MENDLQNAALKRLADQETTTDSDNQLSKKARRSEETQTTQSQQAQGQNNSNTNNNNNNNTTTGNTNNNNNNGNQMASEQQQPTSPSMESPSSPRANPPSPTKVIHIRGLPTDTQEQEVIALCLPFGRVAKILVLRQKQQALVEMAELQAATLLVQYYASVQAALRGLPIYMQFSNKQEITHPSQVMNAPQSETPHSVLLVSVLNLLYPITIEILQQIFSKYGTVQKIALVHKTIFQALIQFSSAVEAQNAKNALEGQNIYSGCCTLRIQYSQLPQLQIKANNDRTRDFLQPNLPTSASQHNFDHATQPHYQQQPPPQQHYQQPQQQQNQNFPQFGFPNFQGQMMNNNGPTVLIVSNLPSEKVNPDILFKLFGVYGDVNRVKILYNKPDTALIQFATPQQCTTGLHHLNQVPLFGKSLQVNYSKHQNVQMPKGNEEEPGKFTRDYTNSPLHRYRVANSKNYQHITAPSPLLFVANVPTNATDDQLRDLFARYGSITNFRTHTKDNKKLCWVQMASIADAVTALVYLHDYKIFEGGPNLRISFSAK